MTPYLFFRSLPGKILPLNHIILFYFLAIRWGFSVASVYLGHPSRRHDWDYCFDLLHPAASASASLQNQRSPFPGSITV
jgi:hypothetical protein